MVSTSVKKLSNTNCIASRHIKMEKSSPPVDMRLLKGLCLSSLMAARDTTCTGAYSRYSVIKLLESLEHQFTVSLSCE